MMYETNTFQILLTIYLYKFQCTNSLQIEHLCEVLRNFRPIFSFFLRLNFDFWIHPMSVYFYVCRSRHFYATEMKRKA